jgi:hypothetical protein
MAQLSYNVGRIPTLQTRFITGEWCIHMSSVLMDDLMQFSHIFICLT